MRLNPPVKHPLTRSDGNSGWWAPNLESLRSPDLAAHVRLQVVAATTPAAAAQLACRSTKRAAESQVCCDCTRCGQSLDTKSLHKFLDASAGLKVIYTDNSLEFGKACEGHLWWSHCTPIFHRSETNGVAERVVCSVKEGASAILLQSGLDEK